MMVRDTNMNFSEPWLFQMKHSSQNGQGYKATFFQFFRRTHKGHKNRNVGPQRPQSELLGHRKGHNQIAYTFWRDTKPQIQGCGLKSISDKGESFETTSVYILVFWGLGYTKRRVGFMKNLTTNNRRLFNRLHSLTFTTFT